MAYDEPPIPGRHTRVGQIPPQTFYLGALTLSVLLLLTAGAVEVVPWPVSILGLVALGTTRISGGHWVSLGGGVLFAAIVLLLQFTGVGQTHPLQATVAADAPSAVPQPVAAPGSLGLTVAELPERWNSLERPPRMTGGLIRETETGPYDSFLYRFDSAASLAGAFDPSDDSVHALVGSVGLFHEAAPLFYLHICFMLHPYSQECIDAYLENGLGGKDLVEYAGVDHSATWEIGDQLWKLEITGDVQTIRVLGEAVR